MKNKAAIRYNKGTIETGTVNGAVVMDFNRVVEYRASMTADTAEKLSIHLEMLVKILRKEKAAKAKSYEAPTLQAIEPMTDL